MVLCRFFLQGTCRFGDSCKFEHQIGDARHSSSSVLRQQQQPEQIQNPNNVDLNTLVSSVKNDMVSAEKGGQWLLSSYAPFKNKPTFQGFEDMSFEEVRWGFYEAQKTGALEDYKAKLQMALQEAMMRNRALQNPTPDLITIISSIYNSPIIAENVLQQNASVFGNASSILTQQAQNSIFGGPTPSTNSIFSPPQSQSQSSQFSFAQSGNSIFSQPNQGVQPQVGNSSIFASANKSVFNGIEQPQNSGFNDTYANTNQSIFGAQPSGLFGPQVSMQQPQQKNNPLFSSPLVQQQQMQNIFASQPPPFSNQPTVASQYVALATTVAPMVAQNRYGNVFGTETQIPGTQPAGSNIFGTANTGSIFGGNKVQEQSTGSMFGGTSSLGEDANQRDASLYSKLEELSQQDLSAYGKERFEFGEIPTKPPAINLCF